MTYDEFKALTKKMRTAQKQYFNGGRNFEDLNKAKALEKQVDNVLEPDLFSEQK